MPRQFKATAIAYLVLLGIVVAAGAYRFLYLYAPLLPPEAAQRSTAYGHYLRLTQLVFAVLVGIWSGLLGAHKRSSGTGLLGLAAGVIVTGGYYALLPVFHFPGGDMTAWLLWLSNAYVVLAAYITTTFVTHQFRRHCTAQAGK